MKRLVIIPTLMLVGSISAATATANATEPQVLVVAAKAKDLEENHYLWAAEMVAARLEGDFEVLPGGLAAGLKFSREHPGRVEGILEVLIDVYTAFEEVRITCFDPTGKERWKRKTELKCGRERGKDGPQHARPRDQKGPGEEADVSLTYATSRRAFGSKPSH